MAAGNRPLPQINADFGGFHNAAAIRARAGAVSAELLSRGFAQMAASIEGGIHGKKQRKHQLEMQERELAERERGDLRQFAIAQMRQNAVNARAMIDIKQKQAERLQREIDEYSFLNQEPPQALVSKLNQTVAEMGQLAAGGAGQVAQANLGEQVMGMPQGSAGVGSFMSWSDLYPRTYGNATRKASTPQAGP